MEKNAGRARRLVLVRARTRRAGNRCEREALYGAPGPRTPRCRVDGWPGDRVGRPIRACRFTRLRERQQSVHTAPHPEALQLDDPPTRPGFITALDDAYL